MVGLRNASQNEGNPVRALQTINGITPDQVYRPFSTEIKLIT